MTTAVSTKRQVQTNTPPSGRGLLPRVLTLLSSSVGQKYLVAITGLMLVGFVIGHLAGNLAVFKGRDAINEYAHFLKSKPELLWVARGGLLLAFLTHIFVSLKLKMRSTQARPVPYSYKQVIQASFGSRTMVLTGLVILAFVVFHIAHYTLGVIGTAEIQVAGTTEWKRVGLLELQDPATHFHDVYAMTWVGFHQPVLAILYIVAQLLLTLHLSHGISSVFQTLGLNSPRSQGLVRCLGWSIALLIGLGNILIVAAIWGNVLQAPEGVRLPL